MVRKPRRDLGTQAASTGNLMLVTVGIGVQPGGQFPAGKFVGQDHSQRRVIG